MPRYRLRRSGLYSPAFVSAGGGYQGPGDIIASGWLGWWGLRAFSAATRGNNLLKVNKTSDTVHTGSITATDTQDFASDATSGLIDASAVSSFLSGQYGCIETLYDQGGGAQNATGGATVPGRPGVFFTPFSISTCFTQADSTTTTFAATLSSSVSQTFTIYAVVEFTGLLTNTQTIIHDGTNGIHVAVLNDGKINPMFNGFASSTGALSNSTKYVVAAVVGGSSAKVYINGSLDSTPSAGTNSLGTGITIGSQTGGATSIRNGGSIQEIGILSGDKSSSMAALSSNCRDATVGWNF